MEGLFNKIMMKLTVVIPVYNEHSLIEELVKRVKTSLLHISEDFEILFVDDGSEDNTWRLIEIEARKETRVRGIKFSRNFGHHYAITAGLQNSNSEWVVVMDGDLQDRPEVIPELFNKAQEGYDLVFVNRIKRTDSHIYLFFQRIFYIILNLLTGLKFDHRQANFSIVSHKVVQAFKTFSENSRYYMTTIKWLGFKSTSINAVHDSRFSGKTSYKLKKRLQLALDVIVSFSERPLRFAVTLGIIMSFTSLIVGVVITFKKLTTGFSEIGWAGLMVSIFFTTGITLMVLGILGIYIGKIFLQVKNRPLYIISHKI
jgi:glycosyltransferase involved in cell wall biosynthesis